LKTRGTSETAFVNKKAAQNLAANRAPITNKTVNKSQKDVSSTFQQGFFVERTTNRVMVWHSAATATATAARTGLLASTAMGLIADPASLCRELDKRMKKIESQGDDYYWLAQK
jgi:hypothetical protein